MDFDFENEIKNLGSCVDFTEIDESNFDYLENTNWVDKEDNYAQ